MQSRVRNEIGTNLVITNRPDSSQLVDLHVYIIPKQVWRNQQNLAENIVIRQAISAGFVRVPEGLTIHDLRRHIVDVCGHDDDHNLPKDWIYLRSVGRCLTKVKQQQEKQLKVKNYRPPITFASEIYLLENGHDDHSSTSTNGKDNHIIQESGMFRPSMTSQSCKRSMHKPSHSSSVLNHHSISVPSSAAKITPRDLSKIREEQERLYHRQIELARQREKMEDEQEAAAATIQTAFRNYRHRQNIKQQQADADEIKRLEEEARELTLRQAEAEYAEKKQVHDVKLSNRLEQLRRKRIELEANRVLIVRRIQRLQTQITNRRKQEKELWKKKYVMEKSQTSSGEEQNQSTSKNVTDTNDQLEQAKMRLNNTTKLRQQAEHQSQLLRQELHEIGSNLNTLEKYRLPKQRREQQ